MCHSLIRFLAISAQLGQSGFDSRGSHDSVIVSLEHTAIAILPAHSRDKIQLAVIFVVVALSQTDSLPSANRSVHYQLTSN